MAALGAFLWSAIQFVLGLFGIGKSKSKEERAEQTALDLGRQEVRAEAAEKAVLAQQQAMDTETRMVEAQAAVVSHQPPQETPHEGTDLFNQ